MRGDSGGPDSRTGGAAVNMGRSHGAKQARKRVGNNVQGVSGSFNRYHRKAGSRKCIRWGFARTSQFHVIGH
jgi:hypothetical protein